MAITVNKFLDRGYVNINEWCQANGLNSERVLSRLRRNKTEIIRFGQDRLALQTDLDSFLLTEINKQKESREKASEENKKRAEKRAAELELLRKLRETKLSVQDVMAILDQRDKESRKLASELNSIGAGISLVDLVDNLKLFVNRLPEEDRRKFDYHQIFDALEIYFQNHLKEEEARMERLNRAFNQE